MRSREAAALSRATAPTAHLSVHETVATSKALAGELGGFEREQAVEDGALEPGGAGGFGAGVEAAVEDGDEQVGANGGALAALGDVAVDDSGELQAPGEVEEGGDGAEVADGSLGSGGGGGELEFGDDVVGATEVDLADDFGLAVDALGFAQPLFNRGRLKANVRATEARAHEAAANYENLMWTAYLEVESALAAEETLRNQQSLLRDSQGTTREAIGLAEHRFGAGMGDIFSILALRRSILETESAVLALQRARIDNRVDLHLALGGSFDDPPVNQPAPTS